MESICHILNLIVETEGWGDFVEGENGGKGGYVMKLFFDLTVQLQQ